MVLGMKKTLAIYIQGTKSNKYRSTCRSCNIFSILDFLTKMHSCYWYFKCPMIVHRNPTYYKMSHGCHLGFCHCGISIWFSLIAFYRCEIKCTTDCIVNLQFDFIYKFKYLTDLCLDYFDIPLKHCKWCFCFNAINRKIWLRNSFII